MTSVDIVVPVRNEAGTLHHFVAALEKLDLPATLRWNVIFVEDGSRDDTISVLRSITHMYSRCRFVSLVQGFGQGAAVLYGMSKSSADAVITMDVDGTHPVELIPRFVNGFLQGRHVVQGVRRDATRGGSFRKMSAALYRRCAGLLTGINLALQPVYFRLVSKEISQKMLRTPRLVHFLRLDLRNFPPHLVEFVEYDYVPRRAGESNYSTRRLLVLACKSILSSMPGERFIIALAFGVAALLVALLSGCLIFSLAWGILLLALAIWYRTLIENTIVEELEVREVGGF